MRNYVEYNSLWGIHYECVSVCIVDGLKDLVIVVSRANFKIFT